MTTRSQVPLFVRHWSAGARAALLALVLFLAGTAATMAATLSARVTDPDGRPVPGAEVRIAAAGSAGSLPRTAHTDGDGRIEVDLAPGRYELRVTAAGLRREPDLVDLGDTPVALDLPLALSAITEHVVVSAAHAEAPRALVPSAVTIVDRRMLDAAQATSVAEALHFVPGLSVARAGGRGSQTSVFTRGGESDYTLVVVDGVRMNAVGGGFDWSSLPAAGVDRVEVVRGPQSAVHGADAIGGLVHVVTASGGPLRASVLGEGGSDSTWRTATTAQGALGRLAWGSGAEAGGSDGYDGLTWSGRERVSNDASRARAVHATLAYADQAWDLRATGRGAAFERGVPGPYGSDPNGTFAGVDRVARNETSYTSGALAVGRRLGTRWRLHAHTTAFDTTGTFTSAWGPSITGSRRVTARAHVEAAWSPRLSWTAGIELLDERGRSSYVVDSAGRLTSIDRRALGAFGEARFALTPRAAVTAGVRTERLERDALPANDLGFPPRPAFPRDVEASVNPRLGASVLLAEPSTRSGAWTRAHASAATGIRAPDTFEIAFTDNPALAPERSRSYDAGIEQGLFDGRLVFDLTWFENHYDDLIVTVGSTLAGTSRYTSDNIANARARGLEASWQARPVASLEMSGTYTWLDTSIEAVDGTVGIAPSPFRVGDPLIRRPAHRATLDTRWRHARALAFLRVEARGGVLDVDPSLGSFGGKVEAPGYATVDAGVTMAVSRRLDVFARVHNLFDRRYEEAFGFPAMARALMAGVRLAHRR